MSRLIFLYQMDLPHRAVAVYTYLHDRANKNGECWPSVKTIAGDIKLSPATVRRAIKDLKNYAAFFEQATFQMETKLLKTSISIAQKIISIEVGENSSKIAKQLNG